MSTANLSIKKLIPHSDAPWMSTLGRFIVLLVLVAFMTIITRDPNQGYVFLNIGNLLNIARNASIFIIIGIGETITLTAKDVDLSVGSTITLTSVLAGIMMTQMHIAFPLAILAALILGALIGLANGLLITKVGLPPFIATYGMMWVIYGVAYLVLQGSTLFGFPENFRALGTGRILDIPVPIFVMLVIFGLAYVLLNGTVLGRRFFAAGANAESAAMSGVKVGQVVTIAYIICGVLAAVAGLVLLAYSNGATSTTGDAYLMSSMAVVVMGGTSLAGGAGNLTGTMIAAFMMAVINNGMNILAVPGTWQKLVVGVMIVSACLLDLWIRNRKMK
jgi:ribose transport system permease protein